MTHPTALSKTFSRSTDPPEPLVVTDCHLGSTLATEAVRAATRPTVDLRSAVQNSLTESGQRAE
jgi:hypothetical protein